MTEAVAADTPAKDAAPRGGRSARLRRIAAQGLANGAGAALSLLTVGGFLLFAERREAAQRLAQDVLVGFGAESSFELRSLDATGLSGRLRVGPANAPDLIVDDLQMAGDLSSPWAGGAFGFQPTAIRMTRPRLRARFDGRRFSFGSLDPVIDAALRRPQGEGPSPIILLNDAEITIVTPAGVARLTGDAGLAEDRVRWLEARLAPAALSHEGARVTLSGGSLSIRGAGDRLRVQAGATAPLIAAGGLRAEAARLRVAGDLPYPDTRALALAGPARMTMTIGAAAAQAEGGRVARPSATIGIDGGVAGDLRRVAFSGRTTIAASASALRMGRAVVRSPEARVSSTRGRLLASGGGLTLSGEWAAEGRMLAATAPSASLSGLRWSAAASRLSLATTAERATLGADLRLSARVDEMRRGSSAMTGAQATLAAPRLAFSSDGRGVRLAGPVTLVSRLASMRAGGLSASDVIGEGRTDLSLSTAQPAPLVATIRAASVRLPLAEVAPALVNASLTVSGRAQLGDTPRLELRGAAGADGELGVREAGRLAAAVPLLGSQPTHVAALRAALRRYRLSAPDLRLTAGGDRLTLDLGRPVEVVSRSGARLTLASAGGELLRFDGLRGRAALRLELSGGDLPGVRLAAPALTISPSRASGVVRVAVAGLGLAPAEGVRFDSVGRASLDAGGLSYALDSCVPLSAERVELGDNDLTNLSGRFCPGVGPALAGLTSGVRIIGRAEALAFDAATLQTEVRDGLAEVRLTVSDAGADGVVRLSRAVVRDAADDVRFLPLGLTGEARARGRQWTGEGRLRAVGGVEVARLDLRQDTATGAGGVTIEARDLRFSPNGLQPGDLSPIGGALLRAASGEAAFDGRLEWSPAGATSSGVLSLRDLDFRSPAGAVENLNGRLELVSLAPIVSAPDQRLTAERVSSVVPLTGVEARLQVIDEEVRIASGGLTAAGGRVVVEPTVIPFAEAPITGAVTLSGVNVGAVFETTDLADRIRIDAPVSGRVPFTIDAGRVRFADVRLTSDRPGRIAIARSALTGLSASEASAGPTEPVNAVQDFAYQALENLAFDELLLTVATRDDGRLGLDFRVRGRFDPPERQEARVPLFDLVRGSAFQRRIPLPSGTGVNLNLDTSLNLDELLSAYAALQGGVAPRSEPVQPAPATTQPTPPLEGGGPR